MMYQCCGYYNTKNDTIQHCHRLVNIKYGFCNKHTDLFNNYENVVANCKYYTKQHSNDKNNINLTKNINLSINRILSIINYLNFIYENECVIYNDLKLCKTIIKKSSEWLLDKYSVNVDEFIDVLTKINSKCIEIQHNYHNDWT